MLQKYEKYFKFLIINSQLSIIYIIFAPY